jgi:hypothetical protein
LELARLQALYINTTTTPTVALQENYAGSACVTTETTTEQYPELTGSDLDASSHGLHTEEPSKTHVEPTQQELDVMDGLFSDLIVAKRRMENYREGFTSVQADNKGITTNLTSCYCISISRNRTN